MSAHSAVLAARPPTRATARAARRRSAQNRHLGSARAPGFPPRRPSRRSTLPRCCQIPDHNPRGRPEPGHAAGHCRDPPGLRPRQSGPGPSCGLSRHHRRNRQPAGGPRRPPARLRRSYRRSARDGRGPGRPSRPPPPVHAGTHTHPPHCAAPPARRSACLLRATRLGEKPRQRATADSGQTDDNPNSTTTPTAQTATRNPLPAAEGTAGLVVCKKKPRQCTTDGRWWTAGRIGGNRSSPNGGAQPLPAVEGTAGFPSG